MAGKEKSRMSPLFFRMKFMTFAAAAFVIIALSVSPAQAGQYVLEKGKGIEVCEAYGKNLNSLMDVPNRPSFRGSRPINPEFIDFSKPSRADSHVNDEYFVWADGVSAEDSERFGEEMDRFLWERDINPVYFIPVTDWPKWRGTPEQRKQAWERFVGNRNQWHFLDIVNVDIDNDGVVEQVAMNARAGIGGILLVLNAKKDGLDMEKTKLVTQHPSWKEQGLGEFRKLFPGERVTLLREKYGYIRSKTFCIVVRMMFLSTKTKHISICGGPTIPITKAKAILRSAARYACS
ncbi:MAG: hypothetical protein MZW92_50755 [Comamonadaceae bacterium]|nr:hypothetical protein [Comamonadaceae bacterium]